MIGDERWVHNYNPENKWLSVQSGTFHQKIKFQAVKKSDDRFSGSQWHRSHRLHRIMDKY
jgi:hypothetical protein